MRRSADLISCDTTTAIQVAIGTVIAVPVLLLFIGLKEAQKRMPQNQLLGWLVGRPWE